MYGLTILSSFFVLLNQVTNTTKGDPVFDLFLQTPSSARANNKFAKFVVDFV